ncbi:MAG: hypothetical protein ACOC5M_02975 [Chloroflexota bacterium]
MTRLVRLLQAPGRAGPGTAAKGAHGQRGYAALTLALIAMVASAALAGPLLMRASGALRGGETTSPLNGSGAVSAAEHGLWRIQNDAEFLDSMSGDPPSASYTRDFASSTAEVTVTGSASEIENSGVTARMTPSPGAVPEETPTDVTYTFTVRNDDDQAHYLSQVEVKPQSFSPDYVDGSTTGITTDDPNIKGTKWRWEIFPSVEVPAHGGEVSMSFDVTVDEEPDTYWTASAARFDSINKVDAPLAAVKASELVSVEIDSSVEPAVVSAGAEGTFEYTVEVTNTGDEDLSLEEIVHTVTTDLDYVDGSTDGLVTEDPHINHDQINDRWEMTWDLHSVTLEPDTAASTTFSVSSALLPGIEYSVSSVLVDEDDEATGHEFTASTGEAAPIIAQRVFELEATHAGNTVLITAALTSTGISVRSWESN